MPRGARVDFPGALQHVMARGIERRSIFRDDEDRERFLSLLVRVLADSGTPLAPRRSREVGGGPSKA